MAARGSSTSASAGPTTSASGCSGSPSPLDLGDRQLPDGPARRRSRRPPAGPDAPRAGRQQRDHHHPERRPRAGDPGHGLRRGRHRRPALHDRPPADRARVDPRRGPRAAGPGLFARPDRRPLGRVGPDGAADQRAGRRGHDGGPASGPTTRRRGRLRRQTARHGRASSSSRPWSRRAPTCRSSARRRSRRSSM